jgi:hypothetical protein
LTRIHKNRLSTTTTIFKYMGQEQRPLRIQYPGAWRHVINRGRRAEAVFLGKNDYSAEEISVISGKKKLPAMLGCVRG